MVNANVTTKPNRLTGSLHSILQQRFQDPQSDVCDDDVCALHISDSAIARPIPLVPPVTTAVLPVSSILTRDYFRQAKAYWTIKLIQSAK